MPSLKILPSGKITPYNPGKTLLEILLDTGLFINNPCNGKGSCGKCKIKWITGTLPAMCETERSLLKQEEQANNIRLACLVEPTEDLTIELMEEEAAANVLSGGFQPDFSYAPSITKKVFHLAAPTLDHQLSLEERILAALNQTAIDWQLLKNPLSDSIITGVFNEDILIGIETGDTTRSLYGIAVDIGTTTVVTALIDLCTGRELCHTSMVNAQKKYGLDVLTRITYELEHPDDGSKKLQAAIVDSLNMMIDSLCEQRSINKKFIYEISIAANCTMMHMLLGINAIPIGCSPYAPIFVKAKNIAAREIGLQVSDTARLYCLPSVSAYIGADIVAGSYVCSLHKADENVLFIDIGTNGEIVLSKAGQLLCCSCAAGPALEGMNISAGMRAEQGAVEDLTISEQGIALQTINNMPPAGLCGSGILAVVKELLRIGLISKDGAFIKKDSLDANDYRYPLLQLNGRKREFILSQKPEQLLVTQGDVRQVQLAKGAILSGFRALLKKAGIQMDSLSKIMIGGQFGAHLPADSLVATGILPAEVKDKITYVGNSSKTGAYMALMSHLVKREMEDLATHMGYMELSAVEGYERLFADCLMFPENKT